LHLDCVGSKSGIFRCVHGFDFGPSGFSFGFFTRALRPGPHSHRALGFLSFPFPSAAPEVRRRFFFRVLGFRAARSEARHCSVLGLPDKPSRARRHSQFTESLLRFFVRSGSRHMRRRSFGF
jgi:hypothetical protein